MFLALYLKTQAVLPLLLFFLFAVAGIHNWNIFFNRNDHYSSLGWITTKFFL